MNPSSAARESPVAVGGVVTSAAATGAGGPPNTSISLAGLDQRGQELLTQQELERE